MEMELMGGFLRNKSSLQRALYDFLRDSNHHSRFSQLGNNRRVVYKQMEA
jgi:hypothetical protein